MCRSHRRCPGHQCGSNLDRHNERRRKNRLIRRNIVAWAEEHQAPRQVVEQLRAAPPAEAKRWAEAQGMDPEAFADSHPEPRTPTHARPGVIVDGQLVRRPPNHPTSRDRKPPGGDIPSPVNAAVGSSSWPDPVSDDGSVGDWEVGEWRSPWVNHALARLDARGGGTVAERQLLGRVAYEEYVENAGVNTTRRITLEDGTVGYFKPFDGLDQGVASGFGHAEATQPIHEVAAWRLAHGLGEPWADLVPPCVIREVGGDLGSFAQHRDGRPSQGSVVRHELPGWREAAFFDALIGQQDRHGANMLHDPEEEKISLIDHGFAFACRDDFYNVSLLVRERSARATALTEQEVDACHRMLDSTDTLGLRGAIEPSRLSSLRDRAQRMLTTGEILNEGTF